MHAQDYAIPQIAWWVVTQRTTQTTETAKIGGGHLLGTLRYLVTKFHPYYGLLLKLHALALAAYLPL